MPNSNFSRTALKLRDSITHGTKAKIAKLNAQSNEHVIDLSIGTLDDIADKRIDASVIDYISSNPRAIHEFAPVKGFDFLRTSISERVNRLRGIQYDPETEVMVTPGGIKGAITVAFHTFLDPGDEVVVPLPNWPHYADMIELHGAEMVGVYIPDFFRSCLSAQALSEAITDKTKMVILSDCLNPSGKIYNADAQETLAEVIAEHNSARAKAGKAPIQILFDCPYESHILDGPDTIAKCIITTAQGDEYALRDCTTIVTGPGKTYGMHGDRVGYICSDAQSVAMMAKVQVNLNSFASTYAQIATHTAMQPFMDEVANARAINSRLNLQSFVDRLNAIDGVTVTVPEGGFFIFADISQYSEKISAMGYDSADQFLLDKAKVASIGGHNFSGDAQKLRYFIRMNSGRTAETLGEAADRIKQALYSL
ncbi:pyridoxal phosphate-dependent aminotransferase [Sessilibacter corallicola]|uniref:Aspartate transaminase AspB n=1 Tax=Sessilibacter corallicola TaxID=2904075 RepID=A0ABQ0AF47_9GAMM